MTFLAANWMHLPLHSLTSPPVNPSLYPLLPTYLPLNHLLTAYSFTPYFLTPYSSTAQSLTYCLLIHSLLPYSLLIYSLLIYSLLIYSLLIYSLLIYSLLIYSLLIHSFLIQSFLPSKRWATYLPMAREAVKPGDSMPTRLMKPGKPFRDSSRMIKSFTGSPGFWSFGRMPA